MGTFLFRVKVRRRQTEFSHSVSYTSISHDYSSQFGVDRLREFDPFLYKEIGLSGSHKVLCSRRISYLARDKVGSRIPWDRKRSIFVFNGLCGTLWKKNVEIKRKFFFFVFFSTAKLTGVLYKKLINEIIDWRCAFYRFKNIRWKNLRLQTT